MSFHSGRLQVYEDKTVAVADYTTADWDSMTLPLTEQVCDLFGMVIFNDLTIETDRGHRYFIGYEGHPEDPKMAIGWAAKNTYSSYRYLLIVGMYDGSYLSNVLDAVSSSSISSDQYVKVMLSKPVSGQTTYVHYFYYIKDTNLIAMSHTISNPSATTIDTIVYQIAQFKIGEKKAMGYRQNNTTNPYYINYDYYNNGISVQICTQNNYFPTCKNFIGNTDYEYIVPYLFEHGIAVKGLYIYSKILTFNKIYSINGEYYFALSSGTNFGTYLIKIDFVPGT
jgi:hypothetical protein